MPSTVALSSLLTRLQDSLDDTATFWSQSILTSWLNEGAADIAKRAECLLATQSYNVAANTPQYTAPVDMVRIHRIEYFYSANDVWPLTYKVPMSMDQIWSGNRAQPSTRPRYYTVWGVTPGATITLFPQPSQSTSSGFPTFNVWYYRLPVAMSSPTDLLDLPQGWDNLPILYAEFRALRKDKDKSWQDAKALYDEQLSEMVRLTRWQVDQSGSDAGEGAVVGYPAWLVSGDEY